MPKSDRVRSRLASTRDIFASIRFHSEEWLPSDLLELAGLAQHYGLPTRLLDWSYDPLIAAYFSAASAKPGTCITVWALDADTMNNMNESVHRSPLRIITPPYYGNPNLAAQSGVFTNWSIQIPNIFQMHESGALLVDRRSLEILIELHAKQQSWEFNRAPFIKYNLPSAHASDVLNLLKRAGYGASRIFPGYRGVAKEVYRKHPS